MGAPDKFFPNQTPIPKTYQKCKIQDINSSSCGICCFFSLLFKELIATILFQKNVWLTIVFHNKLLSVPIYVFGKSSNTSENKIDAS